MQRYVKTVKNFDIPTKCKYCNSRHIYSCVKKFLQNPSKRLEAFL